MWRLIVPIMAFIVSWTPYDDAPYYRPCETEVWRAPIYSNDWTLIHVALQADTTYQDNLEQYENRTTMIQRMYKYRIRVRVESEPALVGPWSRIVAGYNFIASDDSTALRYVLYAGENDSLLFVFYLPHQPDSIVVWEQLDLFFSAGIIGEDRYWPVIKRR